MFHVNEIYGSFLECLTLLFYYFLCFDVILCLISHADVLFEIINLIINE